MELRAAIWGFESKVRELHRPIRCDNSYLREIITSLDIRATTDMPPTWVGFQEFISDVIELRLGSRSPSPAPFIPDYPRVASIRAGTFVRMRPAIGAFRTAAVVDQDCCDAVL